MKPLSAHAYPEYVDRPWHIFTAWQTSAFQGELRAEVLRAREQKHPISKTTLQRLVFYPSLMASLIRRGILNRDEIEQHLNDPSVRFRVMVEDYPSLAPLLEVNCLKDLETAERIRRWSMAYQRPTHHPAATYQRILAEDPVRALRMTPEGSRPSSQSIMLSASQNWEKGPGWAFLYVSHVQMRQIDPQVIEVLSASEEYSYLAASNFCQRRMPVNTWVGTLDAIKSPRWAYLVLRYLDLRCELPSAVRKRLLNIVLTSPGFAVQLWTERRVSGAELAASYRECLRLSAGHPLTPELISWYSASKGAGKVKEAPKPELAEVG